MLEQRRTVLVSQQRQVWRAPYPPPEAAERYEQLSPGAFSRILTMAETDQANQYKLASQAQLYLRDDRRRGHYLGAIVSLAAMAASISCVVFGYPYIAALFLGVPLTAVARTLIAGVRPARSTPPTETPPHEP